MKNLPQEVLKFLKEARVAVYGPDTETPPENKFGVVTTSYKKQFPSGDTLTYCNEQWTKSSLVTTETITLRKRVGSPSTFWFSHATLWQMTCMEHAPRGRSRTDEQRDIVIQFLRKAIYEAATNENREVFTHRGQEHFTSNGLKYVTDHQGLISTSLSGNERVIEKGTTLYQGIYLSTFYQLIPAEATSEENPLEERVSEQKLQEGS